MKLFIFARIKTTGFCSGDLGMYLKLLENGIRKGTIYLHLPSGQTHQFGTGGKVAHWIIHSEKAMHKIARDWEFQLGETYIHGDWSVEDCGLQDLLFILRDNFSEYRVSKWLKPFITCLQQWNGITRSYRNVSHHYDLDNSIFQRFLDENMNYSCGYFVRPDCSLEEAQQAKCQHIANKLLLQPGMRVLDIGCGWGGMAFYLAQHKDVEVVGITLSKQQLEFARQRQKTLGLKNVRFELEDYREHHDHYDRIVSIGMFEHVGKPFYNTFFENIKNMLNPEGAALVHSIGRSGPPGVTNPWIDKYIFPGGSIPALSEMCRSVENNRLLLTDVELLRLHYAHTLRVWFERFQQHRQEICQQMGQEFCRMWEFYLAICEVAFQCSDLVVFQLQMALQHHVIPTTRDYLYRFDEMTPEFWSIRDKADIYTDQIKH